MKNRDLCKKKYQKQNCRFLFLVFPISVDASMECILPKELHCEFLFGIRELIPTLILLHLYTNINLACPPIIRYNIGIRH